MTHCTSTRLLSSRNPSTSDRRVICRRSSGKLACCVVASHSGAEATALDTGCNKELYALSVAMRANATLLSEQTPTSRRSSTRYRPGVRGQVGSLYRVCTHALLTLTQQMAQSVYSRVFYCTSRRVADYDTSGFRALIAGSRLFEALFQRYAP